jgi:hypothetical protein
VAVAICLRHANLSKVDPRPPLAVADELRHAKDGALLLVRQRVDRRQKALPEVLEDRPVDRLEIVLIGRVTS